METETPGSAKNQINLNRSNQIERRQKCTVQYMLCGEKGEGSHRTGTPFHFHDITKSQIHKKGTRCSKRETYLYIRILIIIG